MGFFDNLENSIGNGLAGIGSGIESFGSGLNQDIQGIIGNAGKAITGVTGVAKSGITTAGGAVTTELGDFSDIAIAEVIGICALGYFLTSNSDKIGAGASQVINSAAAIAQVAPLFL